uniref:Glyco_trans_2-like domain-containing protein n=1 Tax=Globodera pallida TaxID=36090 RepID=A0A183BLY5_GLOPA
MYVLLSLLVQLLCLAPPCSPGWLINYIENLFKTFVDITHSVNFAQFSEHLLCDSIVTASFNPIERYGIVYTFFLYLLRFLSLLVLPQCICNSLGLILFNSFKDRIKLKTSPLLAPFICFRVVTKGDYPELVKTNLEKNLQMCYEAGLESFIFEVVTDKAIDLPHCSNRVREVVVPHPYRDEDWIVHLDEETLLSINSLNGILNFCEDGRHQFGQGVITYAQGEIVNWITTLSDSFRVADDMGKLRFQFKIFHKPLFGWKGSFVVTNAGAEKKVSFDHGSEGSIAEDCFFSMIAFRDGYSFDFIEGEMHEKSPFTFWDFLQQRRRWLQGIYLTVHSKYIPVRCKFLLASSLYAWVTMPLTTLQVFLCPFFPLPRAFVLDFLVVFVGAVNLYMYIFGVVKSFSHKYRNDPWKLLIYTLGAFVAIPFNVWIENLAVIMGMCSHKFEFYVVNKDCRVLVV